MALTLSHHRRARSVKTLARRLIAVRDAVEARANVHRVQRSRLYKSSYPTRAVVLRSPWPTPLGAGR